MKFKLTWRKRSHWDLKKKKREIYYRIWKKKNKKNPLPLSLSSSSKGGDGGGGGGSKSSSKGASKSSKGGGRGIFETVLVWTMGGASSSVIKKLN